MLPLPTLLINPRSYDGLQMSGLLFPSIQTDSAKSVIIYLHGNGSKGIFYAHDWSRIVSQEFSQIGISYCTFNNRWGMLTTSLDVCDWEWEIIGKSNAGVWYEKIEDCVHDIDGVVEYLRSLWYEKFFLMGKSTGANKICVYNQILKKQWRKTSFSGYILLSGGDDVWLWYEDMGKELFIGVLANAEIAVKEGRGWDRPRIRRCFLEDFSYQSAYDILNPDGLYNCFPFFEVFKERLGTKQLFQEFSTLDIPTLVIYWEEDEYVRYPISDVLSLLASHNPQSDYETIPRADHGFNWYQKILMKRIIDWIKNI